jgi:pyridoxamine 5'-phosphate oxidase
MSGIFENSTPMVRNIRTDFVKGMLHEDEINKDPVVQFSNWLEFEFRTNELANAMILSTVDIAGMPDSRVMLLRDVTSKGFTFFTNYNSKKGSDLKGNPHASLLFFWPQSERQVRISGVVSKVAAKVSSEYFSSRPFESQVGAVVSRQSKPVQGRSVLDESYAKGLKVYAGQKVPRPAHWGGYLLKPYSFEFWQGRPSRMHDRIQYNRYGNKWMIERLMP